MKTPSIRWINGFSIAVTIMGIATTLTYIAPLAGRPSDMLYPLLVFIGSIFGAGFCYMFKDV